MAGMARSPNPSFTRSWTGPSENLEAFLAAIEETRPHLPGGLQLERVSLAGVDETISGNVAEVRTDLTGGGFTPVSAAGNIRSKPLPQSPAGVRISLNYNPKTGAVSLTVTQADATTRNDIFKTIQRNLPEHVPSVSSSRPSPLPAPTGTLPRVPQRWAKGVRVDGYSLEERLGSGHSGEVWKARVTTVPQGVDLTDNDTVAMKLYYAHMLEHSQSIRIQREFTVASQIDHPNVVKMHDIVISPSRGYSFLVMSYVAGETLKNRIPRSGMELNDIIRIGAQLFDALVELHSRRARHRDVKAANIIVTSPPGVPTEIKLLDFGIVDVGGDDGNTGTSVFLGSKHSAPLEQLTGEEIDDSSDIYAVGSVLYHCYMGEPMYNRVGPEGAIVVRMLNNPATLSQRRDSGLEHANFVDFVNTCIAVQRSQRHSRAANCRDILKEMSAKP